MQNNAFQPFGPTYLVDTVTPIHVVTSNNVAPTSYRIRNTSSSANYFAWSPSLVAFGTPPSFTCSAPTASVPSINTVGMIAGSVEVFTLPGNCWFIANATGFEVTPGEGM